jgi:hypothetical protein
MPRNTNKTTLRLTEGRESMTTDGIEVVSATPQRLIGRRSTAVGGQIAASVMALLSTVWDSIHTAKASTLGINVFLYGPAGEGSRSATVQDVAITAGVLVTDDTAAPAGLEILSTPTGRAAHLAYLGDYSGLGAAHAELREWCRLHDGGATGINWEIYGHHEDDPSKLRTDIYYLLR